MTDENLPGLYFCGLIGRSWCLLFASAGYKVRVYDVEPEQLQKAMKAIEEELRHLDSLGMLRGTLSPREQYDRITTTNDLARCVTGARHIQECVPEVLDVKRKVFSQLDQLVDDKVVFASSSTAIVPSFFTEPLQHRSQTMVAHPINPPFYCTLVELVPAPWTDPGVVESTRALMEGIGQAPITLKKEITGFVQPRIQFAVLAECWRLVQDGVISVADVDRAVVEGLGPRYAFMGPFETCHLNAEGFQNYCERYGRTIHGVQKSFTTPELMAGEMATAVEAELTEWVPLDQLPQRRQWRDTRLMALAKLKNDLKNK